MIVIILMIILMIIMIIIMIMMIMMIIMIPPRWRRLRPSQPYGARRASLDGTIMWGAERAVRQNPLYGIIMAPLLSRGARRKAGMVAMAPS
jgi:hypothetical protein